MATAVFGEGNGTPLQYSCLENPMDGGAWKAAVHGVAEGRTHVGFYVRIFLKESGQAVALCSFSQVSLFGIL